MPFIPHFSQARLRRAVIVGYSNLYGEIPFHTHFSQARVRRAVIVGYSNLYGEIPFHTHFSQARVRRAVIVGPYNIVPSVFPSPLMGEGRLRQETRERVKSGGTAAISWFVLKQ
jgi:hypothetical protein